MFGKWFASTYTGSMIGAGSDVLAVWGWIIAHAGHSGVLEINPVLLARVIGMSEENAQEAIDFLAAPDPKSRSTSEDGRRIVHEGGFQYRIVNHDIYRSIRDENDRREYNRIKQREYRARKKAAQSP